MLDHAPIVGVLFGHAINSTPICGNQQKGNTMNSKTVEATPPARSPEKLKYIIHQLNGIEPSRFNKVTWDFIYSQDKDDFGQGELACIFNDSYDSIENAAESGGVYFATQSICSLSELEGALLGAEVSQKASGCACTIYFAPTL